MRPTLYSCAASKTLRACKTSVHEELRYLLGIDLASESQAVRARYPPQCIIDVDRVERKLVSHPISIAMHEPSL